MCSNDLCLCVEGFLRIVKRLLRYSAVIQQTLLAFELLLSIGQYGLLRGEFRSRFLYFLRTITCPQQLERGSGSLLIAYGCVNGFLCHGDIPLGLAQSYLIGLRVELSQTRSGFDRGSLIDLQRLQTSRHPAGDIDAAYIHIAVQGQSLSVVWCLPQPEISSRAEDKCYHDDSQYSFHKQIPLMAHSIRSSVAASPADCCKRSTSLISGGNLPFMD